MDFARPNGIYKALWYRIPGYKIAVRVHRSRSSSQFDASDLDNLKLINEYLNTLYARFDHAPDFHPASDSPEAFADKFRFLSRRETQVCSFLARHWNTAEIAAALFLSPRTVEKHVERIFGKFDVRTREQLRWRLGVIPTMETGSSPRMEMPQTRNDGKLR